MNATEGRQHALIEALHPYRDAIDSGTAKTAKARRLHRARIRFEGDLRIRLDDQARAHAGKQGIDRLRREKTGRPAPNEHAHHPPAPYMGQGRLQIPE
jgi:hypothetical protein